MQPYTKKYTSFFGYDVASYIPCEIPRCNRHATDIHHIIPKSRYGNKQKKEQDDKII